MMDDRFRMQICSGAGMFEHDGIVYARYNAKLKIAGDSAKVTFYKDGITQGWTKNKKPKPDVEDNAKPEEPENIYDPQERWNKTGKRARCAVYDFIACNIGKHRDHNRKKQSWKFVTYTFREDITEFKDANKRFDAAMDRLNYYFTGKKGARFLAYVAVPEYQYEREEKYGALVWHYHVTFFNLPYIPVSGQMVDKQIADGTLPATWDKRDTLFYIWGEGGVKINALKFSDDNHVAGYVAKYIGKGIDGNYDYAVENGNLHRKRYLRSSGLFGPKIMIAMLDKKQRQSIADYFALHCKHFKKRRAPSGDPQAFYSTFSGEIPQTGNKMFGIDFRASIKQLGLLEKKFDLNSYGFNDTGLYKPLIAVGNVVSEQNIINPNFGIEQLSFC